MSCPNNVAANTFLMDTLVGGTSPYRGEGYSTNSGMYMQPSAEYGFSMMGSFGIVGTPLSKRDELQPSGMHLSSFQHSHYLSQRDTWTAGSKTYRGSQPVAQPLHPCSYPASNVKEEALPCLYQTNNDSAKESAEKSTYIRLGDNNSHPNQSAVSTPEYFRRSQVYTNERGHHGDDFGSDFNPMPRKTTRVETPAADSCVKTNKARQKPEDKGGNTQEDDMDQRQSRKEDSVSKTDSCSDDSECELKGDKAHSFSFVSLSVSPTNTHTHISRCLVNTTCELTINLYACCCMIGQALRTSLQYLTCMYSLSVFVQKTSNKLIHKINLTFSSTHQWLPI